MKKKSKKDFKNRFRYFNKRLTNCLLKTLQLSSPKIFNYLTFRYFLIASYNLKQKYPKNYCILTGHGHSILSDFKLSRHEFKRIANHGLLSGICKASF
jgi:ribosomal protein S14